MTDAWAGSSDRRACGGDPARRARSRDWKADGRQRWTVPLGGGIGKIFHLGRLPVNTQIGAYNNVARPGSAASRRLRAQVQLMFPK